MLIFCIIQWRAHGRDREPLCAGARWLLARGHASPGDTDEWIRLSATTCLSSMPRAKRS